MQFSFGTSLFTPFVFLCTVDKIGRHVANQAATRIQASWRETEEERLAREEQAAIVIQSAFRGYIVRKSLRTTLDNIIEEAVEHAESMAERNVEEEAVQEEEETVQEEEEAVQGEEEVEEQPKTKRRQSKKTNKRSKKKEKTEAQQLDSITYTISVYTGNRWAADTDADLFIILQGENSSSEKHWLRQTPQDMKFAQNQVDTFEIQSGNHGTLSKIVIGHEKNGFGAGIFIERVLVVENIADGRQFFFPCAKWFDSQQVDGKIERTLGCIGFYDMSAAGVDPEATKGRWLLTVHTGDSHGNGGTTSNLSVTAFGSYGQSEAIPISDANLSQAGSFSSFEVSFGEVGELYKLRFETDGSGSSPDYYLDYLEMVDQDTSERITLKCGKWLSWTEKDGEQKMTLQPFRELTVVRADVEPLPLIQYDGVITSTELRSTHLLDGQLEVQIIGEFGETGSFPVAIPSKVAGSLKLTEEIPFNVEAVSVGRIRLLRFTFPVDDSGEAVSEGFALLQSIYDKHNIPVTTAVDWVVHKVVVRESSHAPYRFLFGESHVLADEDRNGVVRKDLLLSEMEGLPTRLSKKRSSKRPPAKWVISLTTGETADAGTNVVPRVTLCGDRAVSDTISLAKDDLKLQPGTTVELELNTEDLGQLYKVRLQMDSLPPADGSTDSDTSSSSWYLKK
uniref:PLAT domain-containing protein n=1 Tax=Plectus sambesii TaxID=2011161 RepID=A0A914ULF0_9BILA